MTKINLSILTLTIFNIVPNAHPIFKYISALQPLPMLLYALAIFVLIYLFQQQHFATHLKRWIGNYGYIFFLLLSVCAVIGMIYPIADGLKIQMRGSDQNDCVILGATKLLRLDHPYAEPSYLGKPCSTGFGMLLMYLPFVFFNAYPFASIVFAALAILSFKRYTADIYQAAIFATLLFASISTLKLLVVGSDLFLLSCGFVILCCELTTAISSKKFMSILGLAVFSGLLASTRVNFLVIVPMISIFIFIHWKKAAIIFGAVSISVAILPSVYIYFLSPADFTPFHLLGKSALLLGGGLKETAIVFSILTFSIGIFFVQKSVTHITFALFISLAPCLIALAAGDFIVRGRILGHWAGAGYLLPIIPLSLAILTNQINKSLTSES